MQNKNIYILGVGNNTGVFIDLTNDCGYKIIGLYHYNDDKNNTKLYDIPIIGSNHSLFNKKSLKGMNFAISVGDNEIRSKLYEKIINKGGRVPKLIHPMALVSSRANIAEGVVIMPKVIVQAGASIDENTIMSYNSSLTHNSVVKRHCYLAANSHVGAYVTIKEKVLIGQGVIIVSSKVKNIGTNVVIGAGSVIINSIPDNSVVVGNPGRIIKKNN